MSSTKIEWATKVWNPVTGCSKISAGCQNCYAERFTKRLQFNPKTQEKYSEGFRVQYHPNELSIPGTWKKPQRIFTVSMGDIFHEEVQWEWVWEIMEVIRKNPQHIFMILTKRPLTMYNFFDVIYRIPDNIWLGVTIEDEKNLQERITILSLIRSRVKFISCEPLLSDLDLTKWLDPDKINWVIAGGETGPGSRPCHPDWIRSIRDQCQEVKVPFFFKKLGSVLNKNNNLLDGFIDCQEYHEFPMV